MRNERGSGPHVLHGFWLVDRVEFDIMEQGGKYDSRNQFEVTLPEVG